MSDIGGRRLQLWSRISSRIDELRVMLPTLDDERWRTRCDAEGWTVALVGCHVSLGLRRQAKWIERVLAGRSPHVFDWERTHALNALVARCALRIEPADVLSALANGLERWRVLLGLMTDADLARTAFIFQEHRRTVEWVASALAPRHVDEHMRSIRAALTGRVALPP